jgi:hypothetical protein
MSLLLLAFVSLWATKAKRRLKVGAMHAAGLLDYPLDSTGFMDWGGPGAGSWVWIYASKEHVYAVIAGLRWDTSFSDDGDRSGPGWSEYLRPTGGFRVRHPLGLLQTD